MAPILTLKTKTEYYQDGYPRLISLIKYPTKCETCSLSPLLFLSYGIEHFVSKVEDWSIDFLFLPTIFEADNIIISEFEKSDKES